MRIEFDPAKRAEILRKRGLDLADAGQVFGDEILTVEDDREDYGEPRLVTIGRIAGRMFFVVWTPRGGARRIISMRKANDREIARYSD